MSSEPRVDARADQAHLSDWERKQRQGSGWRASLRRKPGGALALKIGSLVLGGLFILIGAVLVVLPGPLTIPPILVGLLIISSEFEWADRLVDRAKDAAQQAWEQAKAKPVRSGVITGGGLVMAGVLVWAAIHWDLVAKAKDVVGL